MSLEKAIEHGKEHRKPYYDSRRFDFHCRNNCKCSYCRVNRTHSSRAREYHATKESLDWSDCEMAIESGVYGLNDPWKWMDEEGPTKSGDTSPYGSWSGLN
jgi:hypothetical protein